MLRKNKISFWIGGMLLLAVLTSCEGFWGKKVDPSFIDIPVYTDRQVAYVPIQPVWDNFVHPVDIITGFDELIYVVDDATEEIISLDQAGNELGRMMIPGAKSVIQDRSLDLLVIGSADTLGATLPAIYRLELKAAAGYGLKNAVIEKRIIHPFYYKINFTPGVDDLVDFNAIAIRANNNYYVSRSGPGSSQVYGPDDAICVFDYEDDFVSTVRVSTGGGIFSDYFRDPFGLTSLAQPPQSPFVSEKGDFIFSSFSSSTQLKVQYILVTETDNGTDITVKEMITGDTTQADRFLYTPGRFAAPRDLTYTGDGTNYIFVVDSERDSLYQFTNTGLEGVKPPAGSNSQKNILVSFGGTGNSLTEFREPSGVAYLQRIVYVADAGNGRVLRFKLTTDFD